MVGQLDVVLLLSSSLALGIALAYRGGYAPFELLFQYPAADVADAEVKDRGRFPPIVPSDSAKDDVPAATAGATRECDPRLLSSLPVDHISRDFEHIPEDWTLSSHAEFDAYLKREKLPHPVIIREHTRCGDTHLVRPVFVEDVNNDLDELLLTQKAATATGSYPQIRYV